MITYSSISKVGNRNINEDCVGFLNKDKEMFFALADGLGGHGKGEVASKIVVDKAIEAFRFNKKFSNVLENCFLEGQNALVSEQIRLGLMNEMKSTLVCLNIDGTVAKWGHVGDSRLYVFRKNKLLLRTSDHSVPQMLLATGEIKEKDIRFHEDRNRLIRVMGMEWSSPKYEISKEIKVCPYDSFLMCSDGFWEWIVEKDMIKFLKKAENPKHWLSVMEEHIVDNGKSSNMDNYSAVAVFVR